MIASFVSHGYGLLVIQQMNRYSRRNLEHGEYQCFNWLQLNMSNYCSVNWSWECLLLQLWTFFSVCILFLFCVCTVIILRGIWFLPLCLYAFLAERFLFYVCLRVCTVIILRRIWFRLRLCVRYCPSVAFLIFYFSICPVIFVCLCSNYTSNITIQKQMFDLI